MHAEQGRSSRRIGRINNTEPLMLQEPRTCVTTVPLTRLSYLKKGNEGILMQGLSELFTLVMQSLANGTIFERFGHVLWIKLESQSVYNNQSYKPAQGRFKTCAN
ncbi:hypothetical protein TNCV_3494011 [Trichonephila clavipes]|nr:hypothetical protein TNCV_3494011 [Trichonephila clavipes]